MPKEADFRVRPPGHWTCRTVVLSCVRLKTSMLVTPHTETQVSTDAALKRIFAFFRARLAHVFGGALIATGR